MSFYGRKHLNGIIACARSDKHTHIGEAQYPLHDVADVQSGFEVVARVEIESLLVLALQGNIAVGVFLDEMLFADRFVDGFRPIVFRRGIENLREFPEVGLERIPPGVKCLNA